MLTAGVTSVTVNTWESSGAKIYPFTVKVPVSRANRDALVIMEIATKTISTFFIRIPLSAEAVCII
jgi:hypothetical protein